MASSRKQAPSASARAFLQAHPGKRIAVALSGGMDSVVLLHLLTDHPGVSAIHVHHGLSPNADAWAAFCRRLCRAWNIPLNISKVRVQRSGKGVEAAAREARYRVFGNLKTDVIALAHHLDVPFRLVLARRSAGHDRLTGAGPGIGGPTSASATCVCRRVPPLPDT